METDLQMIPECERGGREEGRDEGGRGKGREGGRREEGERLAKNFSYVRTCGLVNVLSTCCTQVYAPLRCFDLMESRVHAS